jgi:N-acyl-D-aspartate/D-glutamate deacylase
MSELTDKAMRDGAWGLSTGLIYNPGTYSKTPELVALAKVAARHGGFYASHIRDEGAGVLAAVEEALTIGREAGLGVHVSHIKVSGRAQWGKAGSVAERIASARKAGQKVTADQYPYTASSTSLTATVIPARFREGERADLVRRFADPVTGPQLREAIAQALGRRDAGADIRIARHGPKPAWSGKTIAEIAALTKRTPVEVVEEIERNGGAQIINFGMNDDDMRLFMRFDFVATASDGGAMVPDKSSAPHPRSYGTFARKVGFFSIKEGVVPLEQAIRSCSGLPADILGFTDRGYLKTGYFADIVVLDPARYLDSATYDKPHQYAQGAVAVIVNGAPAVENGKANGVLAGRPLVHKVAKAVP